MSRRQTRANWLQKKIEILLRDLKAELKNYYGDRLISAVVFGSVGRGTPRIDSDVDILIVADPLPNGRIPRVEEFGVIDQAVASRIESLNKEGIFTTLAPVLKTPAEVRLGSLLFLDMIDDGRILYDHSGFWRSYIKEFQERLRRLGAKKIVVGDHWYWDLKPDYKVGEIFEI